MVKKRAKTAANKVCAPLPSTSKRRTRAPSPSTSKRQTTTPSPSTSKRQTRTPSPSTSKQRTRTSPSTSKRQTRSSSSTSKSTPKQATRTSPRKATQRRGRTALSKSFKNKNKLTMTVFGKKSEITVGMLRKIKTLQNMVHDLIPKLPFCRLIREVLQYEGHFLIQKEALAGLQCASEYYLTQLFEDCNICSAHAKRVTVMPPDIKLVLKMRYRYDPIDVYS